MSRHIYGSGKFVDVISGKASSPSGTTPIISVSKLKVEEKPLTGWPPPDILTEITPVPDSVKPAVIDDSVRPYPGPLPVPDVVLPDPEKEMPTQEESVVIPEVPLNPDNKPKLIQYAEEYLGRYWFVILAVIIYLFYRK